MRLRPPLRERRRSVRAPRRPGGGLLPHEPPLIAVILFLLAALVLLNLAVPTGFLRADGKAGGPLGVPDRPVAIERQGERDGVRGPQTRRLDVPAREWPRCQASYAVAAPSGAAVAAAADEAGRFRLYGVPDPQTGSTGPDSYDLLRGCASAEAAIVWLNPVRVGVASSGDAATLGPGTVVGETREVGAETHQNLVTTYRIPGGLSVTQTLCVVRVRGRFDASGAPDTLRASYRLRNETVRPVSASLTAVLSPARGPNTTQNSGVPYFANHPPYGPGPIGAVAVASATVLSASDGELPKEIIVPRPGAASSATSYWRPASPGEGPDRIVFDAAGALAVGPALPIDPGGPLTDSSAFAATWQDLGIPPHGSRTLSYEYGQTSGWPGP